MNLEIYSVTLQVLYQELTLSSTHNNLIALCIAVVMQHIKVYLVLSAWMIVYRCRKEMQLLATSQIVDDLASLELMDEVYTA